MNPNMEGNTEIFNNAAVLISAGAAAISALCAFLTFLFSRRMSRRDMVDILKIEILEMVSSVQGRSAWAKAAKTSQVLEGGGIGPRVDSLMRLFKPKYQKDKWYALFPVALEELRKEGYGKLLNV